MRMSDLFLLLLIPAGLFFFLSIPKDPTEGLKKSSNGQMVFAETPLDEAATAVEEVDAEPYSRILVHTEDWCAPCQRFKAESYPALLESGWSVSFTGSQGREVPRFKVTIGEYTESWSGYSNRRNFSNRLRQAIENFRRGSGDSL